MVDYIVISKEYVHQLVKNLIEDCQKEHSLSEIAFIVKSSYRTIQRYKQGVVFPPLKTFLALARLSNKEIVIKPK